MFSGRLPSALAPNALTRAISAHRAAGRRLLDLTCTNPTRVGLDYPAHLFDPLGSEASVRYRPDPRGRLDARAAVARTVAPGVGIDPESVVLTASTSEAYSWLFKLLCNPADRVLVPQPSYPLFDMLTRLEGVVAAPYRLDYHGAWSIDRESLRRETSSSVRAILVVSPNNPTGSCLRASDREWLVAHAVSHGLAIVSDEVFGDYPLAVRPDASSLAGESRVLTFTLGGLSKSVGLPQVKLGWILVSGPPRDVADALARLDLIADAFLSVSTPVQVAAPRMLVEGLPIRHAIHARLQRNLEALKHALSGAPEITLLEPEGGWSVVLRVPAVAPEEAMVVALVNEADVLVHPGFFFDFPEEAYLVLSLLPDPGTFDEGVGRLVPIVRGPRA